MTYQELVNAFNAKGAPGANGAAPHSAAWNDAYNRYFGTIADTRGVPNFDAIRPEWLDDPVPVSQPPIQPNLPDDQFLAAIGQRDPGQNQADFARITTLADAGNPTAIQILQNAGYENSSATEDSPLEQGLLQQALPGILKDIEGDAARRTLADTLGKQATTDFDAARNALSPEENARRLAEELRQADVTSGSISSSAGESAAAQALALQNSIAAMQGNLTGELAAKAAALQQQLASYTANLGILDAVQKAALEEQIAASKQNLEASIATQKQSLTDEITQLNSGVDAQTQAKQAALQQQIAALQGVNTAEGIARRDALTQEIAGLRGAAGAQNQSRMAALQQEIAGLTAAQAPLNQARLDSANALTTGINLGLQTTNDGLTANRAKQGYLGSSTFDSANLARAAIGARQQAAQVMGGAREANAGDMRTIAARGATEGRSVADEYANNLLSVSGRESTEGRSLADILAGKQAGVGTMGANDYRSIADNAADSRLAINNRGATGNRVLTDTFAQGNQTLGDARAAGIAGIKNSTGTGLYNIGNAGAAQSYQDSTGGAASLRALLDSLAKGTGSIYSTQATQQQAARDQGTIAKQGYFDNAYTRGQGAILSRPGLSSTLTSTLTGLDNYGSTGLNRALNTLNWWAGNGQAAPTTGYVPTTANNTGNDISGLGAGLLGSALNIGNANSWWKTPSTTAPKTGSGVDSFVPTY